MADWRQWHGKTVRVVASGVEYRGRVVELGVDSLILRSPTGFREIAWDRISRVEEDPPVPASGPVT